MNKEQSTTSREHIESTRFRILSKTTQDALWDWDIASDHIWWNEGFHKLFGYKVEEIKPSSELWYDCVHPEDIDRVNQSLDDALAQGSDDWIEEYRFRRADGTYAYVQDRGFIIKIDEVPVRMIGSISDISERIQLKRAQEESENWMRIALDASEMGTWTYDPATGEEAWDARCCEIFGLPESQSSGYVKDTYKYVHPDDYERLRSEVHRALDPAHGGIYQSDHRIQDVTTGQIKWVRSRGKAFFTSEGVAYRFAGTIMDITEEKRKEAALASFERRFEVYFNNARLGMVIADRNGKLLLVNQAYCDMLGYTEDEIRQSSSFAAFTHKDDIAHNYEQIRRMISGEVSSMEIEKRYIHKEGHTIWVSVNTTVINGESDQETFFSIVQDITKEKALQDEQRKLLALVENSVELMSILELDGRNSYLNKAGRNMLGFESMQHVLDTPIASLHSPKHFAQVEKVVLPTLMDEGTWSGTMIVRHIKSGEEFPVHNNAIRIDDPITGMPLAVGAVMRDLRPELAAQEALIKSEERFRNLVAQAPVAIGLLRGEEMVVELANDQILELWGKEPKIIGLPLLQALPEIEGQGFMELLQGVLATGIAHYGYETLARLHRKGDLTDAYFNFVYAPVREVGDQIGGVVVIATEVTQQVMAKRDLEESEKRFRGLILDAPVATAIYTGRTMKIQLANEAMIRLWGKDQSVLGMDLMEALPELEGQPFMQLLDQVYTTGVAYHATEDRADLVVDGKLQSYYFNFTYKPLKDAEGKIYAILNMAIDVTHQVLARQQLTETQESLREAIELAELGTWTVYPLTGKVECSDRVRNWIGATGEVVTMKEIAESTHKKDRQRTSEATAREFQPGGSGKLDLEYTVVNSLTGQERIVHTQARAYFNDDGLVKMIRGTTQDITAQRLTQQKLEEQVAQRTEQLQKSNAYLLQTNQELEQYAYVASHDLQEPLRKILIFSGMLESTPELSIPSREILTKIIKSSERMSLLIKDLLEYSQLLKSNTILTSVSLEEVLNKVIVDFELVVDEKNATLHIDSLPTIEAVPLQMNQLFYNLLSNALKFSREEVPPVIRITSRPLTEQEAADMHIPHSHLTYYDIVFSDNGIGFNHEYADRIFELFKRLHTKAVYPGSGIGLALCRRIVQNHQGFMYAESEEQQGAVFHIILPEKQIEE
jgi:PAS domain S-box-containing protein